MLAGTDIVLVATPPAAHAARTVEALEAGCHVLCEKPLALDPGDCRRVVDAAREAGRVASVAFNLRHHPAAQALRAAIRGGRLGRPVAVRSCSISQGRQGTTGWVGDGTAGGDALWEVGSHHADLWRFLLGAEIVEATGSLAGDVAVLTARTSDDVLISSAIGWGAGPQNDIEVLGDGARARASFIGADPLTLIGAGVTGTEPGERLRRGARAVRATPWMVGVARRGGAFQATYAAEWAAFLDAVRGQRGNPCPVEDGLAAAEVVRMLRSACGLSDPSAPATT